MQKANILDRINERVGNAVSWLTTVLVILVCIDVFTRYVIGKSSVAVQELQWHLFAVIFLLGAGYTLRKERHVRVDVLYSRLKPKTKALVDLFGTVFFLIPFCLLVIWTSLDFVVNSFHTLEGSPDPGGLPYRYILKACIPLGFFLLLLQGLSLAIKSFQVIIGKDRGANE